MTSAPHLPRLYYREAGEVIDTLQPNTPAELSAILRDSAFAKLWRGRRLNAEEAAALAERRAPGRWRLAYIAPDRLPPLLGMVAHEAPALFSQLDALAAKVAEAVGARELVGWQVLASYTADAMAAALEEAGLCEEPPSAHCAPPPPPPACETTLDGWSTVPPEIVKDAAR